ncbi:MAG: response regulator [Deltaproteobacteria bacterium]|nr:response regulator [Deltaproteobacteria bacterium]
MIYLPIAGHAATGAESPEAAPPEGGTETVLLAEDEDEVRTITKAMLEEFGYRVIAAFDGEDAVKKFMDNKESVQLIILDVIMPVKGGRQACEEIREIRPDIKVIFITGHAVDNGAVGDARDFLLKPVPPAALLRKVRAVIDR